MPRKKTAPKKKTAKKKVVKRAGRKTKLTPKAQELICSLIASGNYASVAASAAGISEQTFYSWMERGRNKEKKFLEFLEAIKKAESDAETYRVGRIVAASAEHWTAAAWWLERKFPDRWGRKERHEHTGKDGGPVKLTLGFDEWKRGREKDMKRQEAEGEKEDT
jgi:transposase